jgi:magnesium-transporting ATPase (P-type)
VLVGKTVEDAIGLQLAIGPDAEVFREAGAEAEAGGEACRRLVEYGLNAVAEQAAPCWQAFLGKFWSPVPWLLEVAVVIQIVLGRYIEALIARLLLFNATLSFIEEGRACPVFSERGN